MGKKEKITLLLCLLGTGLFAQEAQDSCFVRRGLVRTFGCFAFDYRFNQNVWDYRLHGFLEYFPEKNISIMQEVYYYLDSGTDFPVIYKNFAVGTGLGYHWPKKNFDPYVFFLSRGEFYESQAMVDSVVIRDEITTEGFPSMAIGAGANLYVWKYLNFFVQVRYQRSLIHSYLHIINMDSFSVSYGLGINFHTRKKKTK